MFNQLFGKKQNKLIHKLLISTDDRELESCIIDLDSEISVLCEYGNKLDKLTESQKIFFYNHNFEREINNGGLNQFFFNSSGDFTHETINSLEKIGANKTAGLLKKAIEPFPSSIVPKDRAERQKIIEEIENTADPVWKTLDKEFYKGEDDLISLNRDFVKNNTNDFLN
jgi:hypothetical protein